MRYKGGPNALWLLTLCLVTPLVSVAVSQSYAPPAQHNQLVETDLQLLLKDTTLSQEKELIETIDWIQRMASSPQFSCVHLATSKLIPECKLLDKPIEFTKNHPDLYLEDVKVEYAIKLAMCEIMEAKRDKPIPPKHCEAFIPSRAACPKRAWYDFGSRYEEPQASDHMPCYPVATEKDLIQCFKTLEDKPQYWTSFSNSKTRAVNMCQFSRHAIERERTLSLHQDLTNVTVRLHKIVREDATILQVFNVDLREAVQEFKQAKAYMKQVTDQCKRSTEEMRLQTQKELEQAKSDWQSMQGAISTVRKSVITDLTAHNREFSAHMDAVVAKALSAVEQGLVGNLKTMVIELQKFKEDQKEETSQFIGTLQGRVQEYHEKALLALQIQHSTIVESYSIISNGLHEVHHQVDVVKTKVGVLDNQTDRSLAKIDIIGRRLDGLGKKVETVERAFVVIDAMFGLGGMILTIIAIVLGLCCICIAGRAAKDFARPIGAFVVLSALAYLLRSYSSIDSFRTSKVYPTIAAPFSMLHFFQGVYVNLGTITIVVCFLLAVFLSRINSAWDILIQRMEEFPRNFLCRRRVNHGSSAGPCEAQDLLGQTAAAFPSAQLGNPNTAASVRTIHLLPNHVAVNDRNTAGPSLPLASSRPSSSQEHVDILDRIQGFQRASSVA